MALVLDFELNQSRLQMCARAFVCVLVRVRVRVRVLVRAQVMRHCRKMVSQLSEKLSCWGDDWELPNLYMKLLFVVARCSRLTYCIQPLGPEIEFKCACLSLSPDVAKLKVFAS